MYYTACSTKNVSDFSSDGYRLQCVQNERAVQMMIVITMYNEDEQELHSTLRKVANNITHVRSQQLPGYEAENAWQNILVVIVSDGRREANPGTLGYLQNIGMFDYDAMYINMRGVEVNCHIFESTVRLMKDQQKRFPPMQLVFALKEHNAGKLNSHEWVRVNFDHRMIGGSQYLSCFSISMPLRSKLCLNIPCCWMWVHYRLKVPFSTCLCLVK